MHGSASATSDGPPLLFIVLFALLVATVFGSVAYLAHRDMNQPPPKETVVYLSNGKVGQVLYHKGGWYKVVRVSEAHNVFLGTLSQAAQLELIEDPKRPKDKE
jgi:hypothetical protein